MNRYLFVCLAAVLFFSVFLLPASADLGEIVPYVSLKQEYSDNILFTPNFEKEDFITTATGGLRFSYHRERIRAKLGGRLIQLLYRDNNQLNSTDGVAFGNWNYQATERLSVGLAADYLQDSRRDRDTDTTGLIQSGDREKANFSVTSGYLFSEATKGDVTLEYGFVQIDELKQDEDNDVLKLDFAFSKNLSQTFKNTVGLLNFGYLHQTTDLETIIKGNFTTTTIYRNYTSDVFQLYAGFSHDITELYNIFFQAGANYTNTTEGSRIKLTGAETGDVTYPDQDDSYFGGVLSTGLNYDGLYYDVGVLVSQDMRPSSGTNGIVQRSSVSLNIDRKVSDAFSISFDTSCYLNQGNRNIGRDLDDLTINIQPGFRWSFLDSFTFTGAYRYTSVQDRELDTTNERSLVYLEIRKEFDL